MPLEFNVGEVVDRVRRALGVRGRMPLDMDERLAINVQAVDVDASPFRTTGARFYGRDTITPVAAQFTASLLSFTSGPNPPATHVVDGVWIHNTEATAQAYDIGPGALAATGFNRTLRYPELGAPIGVSGPAQANQYSGAANPFTGSVIDVSVTIPAGDTLYVPLEVAVFNGPVTAGIYTVCPGTVNAGFRISWTGRTYVGAVREGI